MSDQTDISTLHGTAPDALQISEIRYRRLFEAARDGILILDAVSRKITDANPFMTELLGYSREEFAGKELWEIGLFRDKNESQSAFRELQAAGYIRYANLPLETKSGERREVEFVSNVYREGDRQVVQCNIRDNTEHKRVKEESEQNKEWLSAIFEASHDGIVVEENGQIVFVNDRFLTMYGYDSREEVIGNRSLRFQKPEDTERMAEYGRKRARGEEAPLVYEYTGLSKDGQELAIEATISTFNSNGKFYIVTTQKNIAERKQMQEALLRQKNELRVLFDLMPAKIWFKDTENTILRVNKQVAESIGKSVEEIEGKSAFEIYSQTAAQYYEDELEVINSGQPKLGIVETLKDTDGRELWVQIDKVPYRNEDGRVIGIVVIARDITESKRLEDELRRSEASLANAQRIAHIGSWDSDFVNNHLFWSDEVYKIFGISKAQFGATYEAFFNTIHPEDRQSVQAAANAALYQGAPYNIEHRILSPTGVEKFVCEVGEVTFDESGQPLRMTGTVQDITARKQAEEGLKASETKQRLLSERQSAILDALSAHICLLDGLGNILDVNATWRQFALINNYGSGNFGIGSNYIEVCESVGGDCSAGAQQTAAGIRAVLSGQLNQFELEYPCHSPEEKRWFRVNVTPLQEDGCAGVVVMHVNITERKMSEEALYQAEAKYRGIVESMPAIVYLAQPYPPYAPIYVSPNIKVFGYSNEEWFGRSDLWMSLLHEEDRARVLKATEEAMSQGLETDLEYRIIGADRTIHWVRDRGRFIADEYGNKVGWQGVMLEVTKTKELEEQLRQSQKLESVGRLAGGIAHDFNNMLTVISGYSDIVLRRMSDDDPLHRYIEEIKKAGERSASLTQQLLAFSRQQILQPVVLDLNEAVTDTLKMLQRVIGEDVQLVATLNPKTGRVKVDPGQLSQIVMNLTVNAGDAMPEGGTLTIETANAFLDPDYAQQHLNVIPGAYVMLSVRDTGTGIDEETQQYIFEPFFTTKEIGKGTGLGLATVYGIVTQSGGSIEVASEVGRGTTFKIFLPRVAEQTQVAEIELASDELPKGTETILLVEDEEIVRSLTCEVLEMCGYTVLEARNGVEALSICEKHNCHIELLMTDVVMPHMGGWELAEKFAQIYPHMRVLFTSGYTSDTVTHHGVVSATTNFIQKPFALDVLAHKVRAVLDAPPEPKADERVRV